MRWNWQNRSLTISVGELSRFSLLSPGDEGAGIWRMELGQHWHQVLQQRTSEEASGWTFERTVAGVLSQKHWQFEIKGRIDQFKADDSEPIVREIKTVSCALPADENDLRTTYASYFHQAMLYGFLVGRTGPIPLTELLFLEIQTGITQTVRLGDQDLQALHAHLDRLVTTLEERRSHFRQIRSYTVPEPFPEWRPGQFETRETLANSLVPGSTCLFEAPTGFGKTGLVLEQGLKRLAAGEVERILILTGKNTGHSPLLKQLSAFQQSGSGLAIHALRSRKDHTLDATLEQTMSHGEIAERWSESDLSAPQLLAEGIQDLDQIRALGQRHGIPPWAITRILLPYADVWIADFNYLFDPAVSRVLESVPTFDPSKTLLIVDEAHNLPGRAAGSRSHGLNYREVESLLSDVQFSRFPGPLARHLDILLSLLKRQFPCDELDPPAEADLIGLLRDLADALHESSFGEDELRPESREWLWSLPWILADWDHPLLSFHVSCPKKGTVNLSCLDAAPVTGPILSKFQSSILMSATIRPWDTFRAAIGLDSPESSPSTACVEGMAPWLEGCFEVVVDARVDTRYRQRAHFMDTTAGAIAETSNAGKGCTVAFFPSYKYAQQVMERMAFHYPALRCELQPRNLPLEEQTAFLDAALLFDDVLFLVLGSRFSEGIDSLGGKVKQAIVVSPALSEVNALQKAREARTPGGSRMAFRTIYMIPGMQKISQAIGRLVRTPEHRARVLLHGKRFFEPEYLDLLPQYLQPVDTIVTDQDFGEKWLNSRLQ